MPTQPVSIYLSGDSLRSRSLSNIVLTGTIDIPAPPPRLVADWAREIASRPGMLPGDVEQLPLPRARMRWPDYKHCIQAVTGWMDALGLKEVLADSEVALMACRGARYHHDAAQYGGAAFCNVFLSEDRGLDLHFAATGHRIALHKGMAVIFDTGQPHAVIPRHSKGFDAADFPPARDCTQVFLTWELPIENPQVARALGITFDIETSVMSRCDHEQVRLNGAPASVCSATGRWSRVAPNS